MTGGASGLGEAAVRRIVNAGGKAAIFDRSEERGQVLARELGEELFYSSKRMLRFGCNQSELKAIVR